MPTGRSPVIAWMNVCVVCAIAALVLSGCSVPADEEPLSQNERNAIRSDLLDSGWSIVSSEYPEAIRPRVIVAATVPDHDWPDVIVRCLKSSGIAAANTSGGVEYGSSNGQTPLEVAVAFYHCRASNPSVSQIAADFSLAQLADLEQYYVDSLRPCLLSNGVPAPAAPRGVSPVDWNPYQVAWIENYPTTYLGYLAQRCPPVPAWLNLGG